LLIKLKTVSKVLYITSNAKRAYRLEHGHGLFRTYWFLFLPSPFIIVLLIMLLGISIGIAEDFDVMLELLIRGCEPGDGYWCDIS